MAIGQTRPSARKDHIGFAEQEPMLVNDSVWYNLYFEEGTLQTQAIQALHTHLDILNMTDFITKNTLEMTINDKNNNTSGGEKQKISILKVLAKDPSVMILDDPTSALDAETTQRFIAYMRDIKFLFQVW